MTLKSPAMDHDRLFKELLTTFFFEFLELFFPEVAAGLDRQSIQFVDKEVFTDIDSGDRHEVDLLAKVRLQSEDAFVLVHVENQSSAQPDFPRRMFRYFSLLHGKFGLSIYPIALFSFDRPLTATASRYDLSPFGFDVLRFRFQPIQLNRLNWRDFLNRPNPVASALMSKMQIDPGDRPRVKLECLRMLATLKLDPARTRLIGVFMNSYLRLNATEAGVYHQEMRKLSADAREAAWSVDQVLADLAFDEGRLRLAERLVARRFGLIPGDLSNGIMSLEGTGIEEFIEALPDFADLDDARKWVAKATSHSVE